MDKYARCATSLIGGSGTMSDTYDEKAELLEYWINSGQHIPRDSIRKHIAAALRSAAAEAYEDMSEASFPAQRGMHRVTRFQYECKAKAAALRAAEVKTEEKP